MFETDDTLQHTFKAVAYVIPEEGLQVMVLLITISKLNAILSQYVTVTVFVLPIVLNAGMFLTYFYINCFPSMTAKTVNLSSYILFTQYFLVFFVSLVENFFTTYTL